MPAAALTSDMIVVLVILLFTITLFLSDRIRVDVVGLLIMVTLPLTGVIDTNDAIRGLGSSAVVAIIAVMIIGAGLNKTGMVHALTVRIAEFAGKSEVRLVPVLSGMIAVMSGFIQNIGAIALFLPSVTKLSKRLNIPISRILMPLGFCSILGGCLTLIGSSPLILLNSLMESWWLTVPDVNSGEGLKSFSIFSVTPIGIALVIAGILYFLAIGRFLLPAVKGSGSKGFMSSYLDDIYGERIGKMFEVTVSDDFERKTLQDLGLRPTYHATVICIFKKQGRKKINSPLWSDMIEPGDVLAILGTIEHAKQLAKDLGWSVTDTPKIFTQEFSADNAGIAEAIITPHSGLAGHSLRELHFSKRYMVNVLALFSDGKVRLNDLSNIKLKHGDALLLQGNWPKFVLLGEKLDLVFTERLKGEILRPEKSIHAVVCLVGAMAMNIFLDIDLPIAMMTGAVGMVLTKVLSIDEAYKSVDWMTVFLLGGLIPLGIAFNKTGTAVYIAQTILGALHTQSPFVLMLVIGLLTSFFTLVISNVGATVLLVPLSMNMAISIGADPRIAALVVAIAASNTFILPTHQVNALIMRPGDYKALDYLKPGTGMTLIFIITVMVMLWLFYGVTI